MKAWVFNEEQLHAVLESWLAEHTEDPAASVDTDARPISRRLILEFLHSAEAAKLRVGQLEPGNAAAEPQR